MSHQDDWMDDNPSFDRRCNGRCNKSTKHDTFKDADDNYKCRCTKCGREVFFSPAMTIINNQDA